jgi:hypothetical protein
METSTDGEIASTLFHSIRHVFKSVDPIKRETRDISSWYALFVFNYERQSLTFMPLSWLSLKQLKFITENNSTGMIFWLKRPER